MSRSRKGKLLIVNRPQTKKDAEQAHLMKAFLRVKGYNRDTGCLYCPDAVKGGRKRFGKGNAKPYNQRPGAQDFSGTTRRFAKLNMDAFGHSLTASSKPKRTRKIKVV